jgi:hypothetical protein
MSASIGRPHGTAEPDVVIAHSPIIHSDLSRTHGKAGEAAKREARTSDRLAVQVELEHARTTSVAAAVDVYMNLTLRERDTEQVLPFSRSCIRDTRAVGLLVVEPVDRALPSGCERSQTLG